MTNQICISRVLSIVYAISALRTLEKGERLIGRDEEDALRELAARAWRETCAELDAEPGEDFTVELRADVHTFLEQAVVDRLMGYLENAAPSTTNLAHIRHRLLLPPTWTCRY